MSLPSRQRWLSLCILEAMFPTLLYVRLNTDRQMPVLRAWMHYIVICTGSDQDCESRDEEIRRVVKQQRTEGESGIIRWRKQHVELKYLHSLLCEPRIYLFYNKLAS